MKYPKLIISLIIISFFLKSNAQTNYIATDSTYKAVKLIPSDEITNSQICTQEKGNQIIKYTPDDLSEYGFKNGQIFISKEITINNETRKVFLERLEKGDITLYYYKSKEGKFFFIEKESNHLVEIKEYELASTLFNQTSKCKHIARQIGDTKYKKNSLKTLIYSYNNCNPKYDSFRKSGFLFGGSLSTLRIPGNTYYTNRFLNENSAVSISGVLGGFIDIPLDLSQYSFHPEIYGTWNSYKIEDSQFYSNINFESKTIIKLKTASINIPLLIRYTFLKENNKPFINIGPILKYNFGKSTTITENSAQFNDIEILKGSELGYILGMGIELSKYNRSKYIEIRYTHFSTSKPNSVVNNFFSLSIANDL